MAGSATAELIDRLLCACVFCNADASTASLDWWLKSVLLRGEQTHKTRCNAIPVNRAIKCVVFVFKIFHFVCCIQFGRMTAAGGCFDEGIGGIRSLAG